MTIQDFITGFTFPHEGITYEDVPGDDGGPTKFGIDLTDHPGVDIANLTADQATSIYLSEYNAVRWYGGGPALPDFPGVASLAFFDAMEVCGLHEAWLFVQRALGLQDDGWAGPMTKAAIISAVPNILTLGIINQRKAFHHLLAEKYPHDQKFLQGWINRCDDLITFLSCG